MRQDTGRRVVLDGALDDLAGMDACAVEGAPEQLLESEDPVALIEPQHAEDLVGDGREPDVEKLPRLLRAGDGHAAGEAPPDQAAFEALMREAVAEIDAWITARL